MQNEVTALILAGGKGLRFSEDKPKQFFSLNKKPVIIHTLEVFEKCPVIDSICVVCLEKYVGYMSRLCKDYSINKVRWVISGGDTRHRSIRNGFQGLFEKGIDLDSTIVIHNANMPLVTNDIVTQCIEMLKEKYDIISTVTKCNEYLLLLDNNTGALSIGPDRDNLVFSRLPESIKLETGISLYLKPDYDIPEFSSYSTGMLGLLDGKKVGYVECQSPNFKITYSDDLKLMEAFFDKKD